MIKKGLKLLVWIVAVFVVIQIGRQFFLKEEYRARNDVYEKVKEHFPDAYRQIQAAYGLFPYDARTGADAAAPAVILVHGLDEPGRIWRNLAPALDDAGYHVMFMSYPNDQKITDSARFFYEALRQVADILPVYPTASGRQRPFHIVCHSMGGLVTREMLTDPGIDYGAAAAAGTVPRISTLIMAGTPNHGSELARFRFFMEVRDQIQGLFDQNTEDPAPKWLRGLLDGTGAAGMDLLPGSIFLTRLNSRPHPPDIDMYVIAGILSPWSEQDIRSMLGEMKKILPGEEGVDLLGRALTSAANGVGDGLVSMASARLDRIPLVRVRGTHLTMLRNLTRSSTRVPPAVPVILDILKKSEGTIAEVALTGNFYWLNFNSVRDNDLVKNSGIW